MSNKRLNKMEKQIAVRGDIKEYLLALAKIGCNPTWQLFEKTYNWFCMKKKLSMIEQDEFQELWIQAYQQQKGAFRKTCR